MQKCSDVIGWVFEWEEPAAGSGSPWITFILWRCLEFVCENTLISMPDSCTAESHQDNPHLALTFYKQKVSISGIFMFPVANKNKLIFPLIHKLHKSDDHPELWCSQQSTIKLKYLMRWWTWFKAQCQPPKWFSSKLMYLDTVKRILFILTFDPGFYIVNLCVGRKQLPWWTAFLNQSVRWAQSSCCWPLWPIMHCRYITVS